jgi:hypothetical protein
MLTQEKGWWNFTYTTDIDADGDLDIVAGNLGLNSRLKATPEQPVHLYVNDFDKNGSTDGLLTYYLADKKFFLPINRDTKAVSIYEKEIFASQGFCQSRSQRLGGKH